MTTVILCLGLGLGALTLFAQPAGDAEGPREEADPKHLRISLDEVNRLLERMGMDAMSLGETRVIRPGRPLAATPATPTCLAQPAGSDPDPCRVGEAISRMPACRTPDDCPAYDAWTRLYGTPRSQLALPDPETRALTDAPEERE
jgi:hypothetical protein